MREEELDRLWDDPKNYKGHYAIYSCKKDPRVIVLKRQKWAGWTLNFAHPQAYLVLISLFLFVLIPPLFVFYIWPKTEAGLVVAFLLGGVGVVTLCVGLHKKVS